MPALDTAEIVYYLRSGIEIAIIWAMLYLVLASLERISAGGKLKGLSLGLLAVAAAWMLARYFQLNAISWLLQASVGVAALGLLVVFQPELRRLLSRLGGIFPHAEATGDHSIAQALVDALIALSARKTGALIVIERNDRLDDYIRSAPFDCELSGRSLLAVFWKDAPLHDGAVIIRNGRIAAAGVILPLTAKDEYRGLSGTRHRAAIGISEDTDAVALVVSEETGGISVAERGEIERGLSRQDLELVLGRLWRSAAVRGDAPPVTRSFRRRTLDRGAQP